MAGQKMVGKKSLPPRKVVAPHPVTQTHLGHFKFPRHSRFCLVLHLHKKLFPLIKDNVVTQP